MEFSVKFSANHGWAVNFNRDQVGFLAIDNVRQSESMDIPLSCFDSTIESKTSDPFCVLSEEMARESGLFDDKNEAFVYVPKGYFNQFCQLKHDLETNEDGVVKVKFKQEFNKLKALDAWRQEGYPTTWGFESEPEQ